MQAVVAKQPVDTLANLSLSLTTGSTVTLPTDSASLGLPTTSDADAFSLSVLETTADLYSPLSGDVTEVNQALTDRPELVNQAPYDEGWMIKVRPSDPGELEPLMNAAQYAQHVGG